MEWKEAAWDKYVTGAPRPRTPSEQQYIERATLALSLMLHELGTNAVKYVALGTNTGKVDLTWSIERDQEKEVLALKRLERGGPPAVAPTRKGFGSRIIRMGLIGPGDVALRYEATGLEVDALAPFDRVREA